MEVNRNKNWDELLIKSQVSFSSMDIKSSQTIIYLFKNMDGPRGYYTKWNKSKEDKYHVI